MGKPKRFDRNDKVTTSGGTRGRVLFTNGDPSYGRQNQVAVASGRDVRVTLHDEDTLRRR